MPARETLGQHACGPARLDASHLGQADFEPNRRSAYERARSRPLVEESHHTPHVASPSTPACCECRRSGGLSSSRVDLPTRDGTKCIGSAQPGLEGGAPRLPPQRVVTLGEERTETMGVDHGEQVRMHVRPHQFGYGFSETVYRRTRVDVSYSGYSR